VSRELSAAIVVVLLANSTETSKRKEGKEEDENNNGRERVAEVLKTWCVRIVKFLHHALHFFMLFVLWRIGCCCFKWVPGIRPANFLDTVCGG
jgi:hypothetical protein